MYGSANLFMHIPLIGNLSNLSEEEMWNPRKVKGEFIWHDLHDSQSKPLKLTIVVFSLKIQTC